MNTINSYNKTSNLNIENKSITKDLMEHSEKKYIKTEDNIKDNIEIRQKNKTIINTKKAYEILQETCKETGAVECGGYISGTMQLYFNHMIIEMEDRGIPVPDFNLNGLNSNNNNFLMFVDRLKDFANELIKDKKNVNVVPNNFFDFCDLYKKKLKQNGCS